MGRQVWHAARGGSGVRIMGAGEGMARPALASRREASADRRPGPGEPRSGGNATHTRSVGALRVVYTFFAMPTRSHKPAPGAHDLHGLLSQANRQATSKLRRMVSGEGVPVEFWRVLEVLADERGRSMSVLAEQTGMQMSAMSKLVDRMTDAALIQRSADPVDQRRVILHVSDFGLQKVAALRDGVRAHRDRVGRAFGPDRETQLRELLREFIQAHR